MVLLTPEKSAVLVGKPGIGKTAIVEGLAYRLQLGDIPNALKGHSVYKISTPSLVGNHGGENKVMALVDELKTKDKIILLGQLYSRADMHTTPISVEMPGVLIHAHILATILGKKEIIDVSKSINYFIAVIITFLFCGMFNAQ